MKPRKKKRKAAVIPCEICSKPAYGTLPAQVTQMMKKPGWVTVKISFGRYDSVSDPYLDYREPNLCLSCAIYNVRIALGAIARKKVFSSHSHS